MEILIKTISIAYSELTIIQDLLLSEDNNYQEIAEKVTNLKLILKAHLEVFLER